MIFDLFLGILYLALILILFYFISNILFKKDVSRKRLFLFSLFIKLVSSILFGIVYQFYYGYGDCMVYFKCGLEFFNYVKQHPKSFFDFLVMDSNLLYGQYQDFLSQSTIIYDYFNTANIFVAKTSFLFGFFTFFTFFPTCIIFALIPFLGSWKIYSTFSKIYPQYEKYFRISFLFIPSAIFWTSGIGKDALCLGLANLFVACFCKVFILGRKKILNLIIGCLSIYVVFIVKSYIVISLLPCFIYYLASYRIKNIASISKQFILKGIMIILIALSTLFTLFFTDITNKISDEIISGALYLTVGQQNAAAGNDSKYELGITFDDIKNKNIIPFIIPSINVALFRPYLWEVNKPLIIFSFLESCFFLFFTVYVFAKGKIIRTLSIILSNELLVFSLLFSIIFAFFVGLVSANFGTLIRYKTPFISYFLLALFIINSKLKENKSNSK